LRSFISVQFHFIIEVVRDQKMIRACFLLLAIGALSSAINLDCTYVAVGFDQIGGVYYSHLNNMKITSLYEEITGVTGTHISGHNNDGVKGFNVNGQTCHFLPMKIENTFKNLEALQVHNSGLKQIKKEDLKPFYKLRGLWMRENQLEVLEKDLFMYNTQLELIMMNDNKIKHIDGSLIDLQVQKLVLFSLQNNVCINIEGNTKAILEKLPAVFKKQCQDSRIVLELKMEKFLLEHETASKQTEEHSAAIILISNKLDKLENNLLEINKENGICKCQLASLFMNFFNKDKTTECYAPQ